MDEGECLLLLLTTSQPRTPKGTRAASAQSPNLTNRTSAEPLLPTSMAYSDDEEMLGSEHEMEQEEEQLTNNSVKGKGKEKEKEKELGEPVALPGALHGHELDNLPWWVVLGQFSRIDPASFPSLHASLTVTLSSFPDAWGKTSLDGILTHTIDPTLLATCWIQGGEVSTCYTR